MKTPFIYLTRDIMITKPFEHFTEHKNRFCYPNKRECKIEVTQVNLIPEAIHTGVLSDEIIEVDVDKEVKTN
jgi:hypothetical protein